MKQRLIVMILSAVFFTANAAAQKVTLKQIGKNNMLTISFSDYHKGILYTIDNRGALYKTDLSTGEYTPLGKQTYDKAKFFFTVNSMLYIIENDGSMNQVNPATGSGSVVAPMGSWERIEKVFVVRNSFYAVENGSLFYYPILNPNNRKQIGGSDFYSTGLLMRTDTTLHSLLENGSLYKIDLHSGKWERIGAGKSWKSSRGGAVLNNKLYTVEQTGSFFETNLTDGTKKELETEQATRPRLLFSEGGKLYLVTVEGNLYEVVID